MASKQDVKSDKIPTATGTLQEATTKTEKSIPVSDKPPTEELKPISKQREWKLLYAKSPPDGSNPVNSRTKESPTESSNQESDSGKYKGLCKNCKKRETCSLPKPEGGVWRCEHYE
jgi:hypothetical protein